LARPGPPPRTARRTCLRPPYPVRYEGDWAVREICASVLDVTCGGAGLPGYPAARPGDMITRNRRPEVAGPARLAEAEIWF
jgi:hypothetical protein